MSVEHLATIEQPQRPVGYFPYGLPGSGKTSLCERMQRVNPNLARVSRDDLRAQLFGGAGILPFAQEQVITKAIRAQAKALFAGGYDVFFDETHLRRKRLQDGVNFAVLNGADYQMIDLDTSVDECVRRDAARGAAGGRLVGEDVIRGLARKFSRKNWEPVTPSPDLFFYPAVYVPDPGLPPAWVVDVDGTLCEKAPTRDIYDYTRVHEDTPIAHTVQVVRKLAADSTIVILSGRDDDCKDVTAEWLQANGVPFNELHMRVTGDKRPDFKVKTEIFDEHIRHRFHVLGMFDDRLSVCRAWDRMGLPLMRLGKPDHDDF